MATDGDNVRAIIWQHTRTKLIPMANHILRIGLNDRVGLAEVTPDAVPLALLKQFADEVGRFLAGSKKEVDIASIPVAIVKGSLEIVAQRLPENLGIWADLDQLEREDSLHSIDPGRALVVAKWQESVRNKPNRRYSIAGDRNREIVVSSSTAFRESDGSPWVRAERYIRGSLYDAGGKTTPNIHLQLADGKTLPVKATREQLRDDEQNHLYHEVLVRVTAEQNLETGELRNAQLIRFEDHGPGFDPDAFAAFVAEGNSAWSDVNDPAEWVRQLRGG